MSGFDLQSLIASLPDAVISIDRTSTIVHANEAALVLFGYAREEFVGAPLAERIIPPELRDQHARGMQRFLGSGAGPVIGRRIDISAIDRTGRRFPIELCVFLDRTHPSEVFHASIRETTDRVARDAVIAAERERLRQILDVTADAWWDCVIGGQTRFSDSAPQVLGCASAELASGSPSAFRSIHLDDRGRVAEAWRAHLAGESARFECTHRVVGADGSIRWIRQRGRAVEFELGRPVRIMGTVADVTEQQSAEERLRNAQRLEMLGLLAGGFAHDLNNLLAAIRGHAALAATEPGTSAAAIESLASVQLATTKARMLTANMLSLGKPAAASVVRIPLRTAVDEVLEIVRPNLPRTITVSAELSAVSDIDLELDPSAFQQAMLNLLVNARDAMPSGGRLRIEAAPFEEPGAVRGSGDAQDGALRVRIVVEDTGVGIPPETLARIFEPFYTTKPQGVGTGLGLAVVQRLATSAGGTISVMSDVGRGTRFVLVLPALRASSGVAVAELPSQPPCTVLLCESHAVLRPMLAEALRAVGHTVIESDGGAHAVRCALDRSHGDPGRRVGVLVSELGVGPTTGERAHAQIEAAVGTPLPAVFMSADPGARLPAPGRGDIVLLQKPFEITDLVSAIERVRG